MKAVRPAPVPQEIELKLALPTSDSSALARRLARTPLLAKRKSTQTHLRNIYFDTPELALQQQRVALRLRSLGGATKPTWLQTLKTTGRGDSALSRRGEWEFPVSDASLSLTALLDTPWSRIDMDGTIFPALAPVFETNYERTAWLVRRRDGSVIEVALDIGQIVASGKSSQVCELELELKSGKAAALFDVARQIANSIALLPASASKAERGYALARNAIGTALHARPQPLPSRLPLTVIVQRVLLEMFSQFTTNLNTLLVSDDPEVVHQARVGWRRFRSARRFFKPFLAVDAMPSWLALEALLACLGKLRDLDVARTETLPPLATVYTAEDPRRADVWQGVMLAMEQAANLELKAVRYALQEPTVGASLLATTEWLENLAAPGAAEIALLESSISPRRWTRARIRRLHKQLKLARKRAVQPEQQHRVRILAKRMRYNIQALQSLLPSKLAQRWQQQAIILQSSLGMTRDAIRAATLVTELELDRGLAEFLRGVAVGQKR